MSIKLGCGGYVIDRSADAFVQVDVKFYILIPPNDNEQIAEALKQLELYFANRINLVKAADDKHRCFHCGTLNELSENLCSQCGAPL